MLRILFLSDTHIGLDWPQRPRVKQRRRGDDFWKNYLLALQPAFRGQADIVIHGGDLLYRSRVRQSLFARAFEPLVALAEQGVDVFILPGNHERSRFPLTLFERHPKVRVFDCPRSFLIKKNGMRVAFCGFPFFRGDVRRHFSSTLSAAMKQQAPNDFQFLCMHHPVDGAAVGPGNFVFRNRPDTVDPGQLPEQLTAVLSGHIHRHQCIRRDLAGNRLPVPVLYAGSVERTSFAEQNETKGFMLLELHGNGAWNWDFHPLPARPMVSTDLTLFRPKQSGFHDRLVTWIEGLDADSIVRLRIRDHIERFRGKDLRKIAPETMNIYLSY